MTNSNTPSDAGDLPEAPKQPYDYRTENGTPKSPKQSKKAKWQ